MGKLFENPALILLLMVAVPIAIIVVLVRVLRRPKVTTPPAPSDTPAGWYPNPEAPGRRYWDGAKWTADTAP